MSKGTLSFLSKVAILILCAIALTELALALWTVLENRYKSLAYSLADVGYIDLWILRYMSLCLFASSIITSVMCLILIWGLCSAHVFIFIGSTMIVLIAITELIISIVAFSNKFQTRLILLEQLPKLVITYRQGTDERANRALDFLHSSFRCCGADGRLSFQNNVPLSCNMFSVGCLTRTIYFLNTCMDALAFVLLFFSLIKLCIILFLYSYLCIYQHDRRKHCHKTPSPADDRTIWQHSSPEGSPKKSRVSFTPMHAVVDDYDYDDRRLLENRSVVLNDYDISSSSNPSAVTTTIISPNYSNDTSPAAASYEQRPSRKLSSISELTEKTETDDSEPDLSRPRLYNRHPTIIATPKRRYPPPLPRQLPVIIIRRSLARDDEYANDSGVERSSSEKSFDDQLHRRSPYETTLVPTVERKSPSSSSLTFSKVCITSVSQTPSSVKPKFTPRSSLTQKEYSSLC